MYSGSLQEPSYRICLRSGAGDWRPSHYRSSLGASRSYRRMPVYVQLSARRSKPSVGAMCGDTLVLANQCLSSLIGKCTPAISDDCRGRVCGTLARNSGLSRNHREGTHPEGTPRPDAGSDVLNFLPLRAGFGMDWPELAGFQEAGSQEARECNCHVL